MPRDSKVKTMRKIKQKTKSRKMPKADERLSHYDFSDKDKFFAYFFLFTSLLFAIALFYVTVFKQTDESRITNQTTIQDMCSASGFYGYLNWSYTEDRYIHDNLWMTLADNGDITGYACGIPIIKGNYIFTPCSDYTLQIWNNRDTTKNLTYIDCNLTIDNQNYSIFWAECDSR